MVAKATFLKPLVEVFDDQEHARAAVRELKAVGFTDSQIRVVSHHAAHSDEHFVVGQRVAVSLGEASLSKHVVRAADSTGAFQELGVSDEDATHYELHLRSGRTIVTVRAGTRSDIAASVLNRFNRADRNSSQAM